MASPGDKWWPLSYRCSVSHDDGGGGDDSVDDDDDGSIDDDSNDDDFPGPVPRGKFLWMSKDWSMMDPV